MCVCVCVCVRACAHACACVYVCMCYMLIDNNDIYTSLILLYIVLYNYIYLLYNI